MAFYRIENSNLIKVESDIFGPGWQLLVVDKDLYEYPYQNWYWFDTDEEAKTTLGVDFPPKPSQPESPKLPFNRPNLPGI